MNIPTRAQANELLDLWKAGAITLTHAEIMRCLYATGDIDGR